METTNKTEKKTCWCGGTLTESIHNKYFQCKNCGTFVSKFNISQDKLKAFYTYDGYWHDLVSSLGFPTLEQRGDYFLQNRVPTWFELLKSYKPNVTYLLEIGCAEGSFLYYCKQKGIKHIVGVEVDPRTCEYAKQQHQLEHIYPGLYPEVELPYSKYDVVAGFDVLEHFVDPISTLKHIYENLKDDGIGIFQTPRYRNDNERWLHFKADEHLFLFNETNIRLLFDRCGFDVLSITKGSLEEDMNIVVRKKINVDALMPQPLSLINRSEDLKTCTKKKIVIGLIEHFGDIVACEPVSRYLRSENPNAYILWCVKKEYTELVFTNPYIDEVITVDCLTEWIMVRESGIYDEIVDLHIDGRICPVCNIPLQKELPFLVNGDNYYKVGNLLSAFSKGAGLPALDGTPNVYIDELSKNAIDNMQLPPKYVVVHAKTNEPDRDWNIDAWVEVISHIHETYKLPVIEVGHKEILERKLPGIIRFAGKTSYLQTAEIIRRAELFIGVDSGPAHLANAVRTKGVIILGAYRNFQRYLPYSGYYSSPENALLVYNSEGPASSLPSYLVISAVDQMLAKADSPETVKLLANNKANEYHSPIDWTYPLDNTQELNKIVTLAENSKATKKIPEAEYYYTWAIRILSGLVSQLIHSTSYRSQNDIFTGQIEEYFNVLSKLYSDLSLISSNPKWRTHTSSIVRKLQSVIIRYSKNHLIEKAEELIQSQNLHDAQIILEKIIDSCPLDIDALNDIAVVKILQNEYDEALEFLKRVLKIDPANTTANENIQVVLSQVNQIYDQLRQ